MKTERGNYDMVVKDMFQRDHPSLLDRFTGGVAVVEVLNVELARIEERRADLVFLLADGTILHIEFQSVNDKDMPYRTGVYCLLLAQKYRRRIRQVVLYIGPAAMRMDNQVDLGETRVAFTLMDIREIDARELMTSSRPGDLALAILAGGGLERLTEIVAIAAGLQGVGRRRVFSQLALLSGLRRLPGRLRMELRAMSFTPDLSKNIFVQEVVQQAVQQAVQKAVQKAMQQAVRQATNSQARILRGLLTTRFGPLPKWAADRLSKATVAQMERWSKKILKAGTLEGVLGKRR